MKSTLPRITGFLALTTLIACVCVRAQESGQLSGGLGLAVGTNGTTEAPVYQIAGHAPTEEPLFFGTTASVSGNVITFATQTDLEDNDIDPFTADVLASGTVRATATVNGGGAVTSISVDSGGSGLTATPTVTIDDPDANTDAAEATATVAAGAVTGFTITNGGDGYSSSNPPSVTVDSGPHFIRLASGTNEGRYFLIASNTATTLTIDTGGLASGEADATAVFTAAGGDSVEILRGNTLGDVFGVDDTEIKFSDGAAGAGGSPSFFYTDWVYLWDVDFSVYVAYYFNDGTGSKPEGWYKMADFFSNTPRNDTLIYPDEAFILARRFSGDPGLTFDGELLLTDPQLKLPAAGKRSLMSNPFGSTILLTELLPTDAMGTTSTKFYAANDDETGDLVYVLQNNAWSKFYHKTTNISVTEVATCTAVRLNGTGGVASAYLAYPPDPSSLSAGHKCTISAATNPAPDDATPSNGYTTITTGAAHGLEAGDIVTIKDVNGYKTNDDNSLYLTGEGNETSVSAEALVIETSTNGVWVVQSVTPLTFTIPKSGNAVYKDGGYWATGSGGAGYTGDAKVYFIGNGSYDAKGTATVSGGKVTGITGISAGTGYGTTTAPQILFSSGSWRDSTDPNQDQGNFPIGPGAGILISRHASNSGVETYLKSYNPANPE